MLELQKLLINYSNKGVSLPGFLHGTFFRGEGGKIYCYGNFCYSNFSIVFRPNFRGGQKSLKGGKLPQGAPPGHPVEKSQSAR